MAKCRNMDTGLFITLTWPDAVGSDYEQWRQQRNVFFKRLRRKFPKARCIWRVEYKVRKSGDFEGFIAPHLHLLLFGEVLSNTTTLLVFRQWLMEAWSTIAHSGDATHGQAATQADVIHNRRHATRYASKYAGKAGAEFSLVQAVGRHWGYWGDWDISEIVTIALSFPEFYRLKIDISRWLRATDNERRQAYGMRILRAPPYYGFSVLGLGDMSTELCGWENSDIMRLTFNL